MLSAFALLAFMMLCMLALKKPHWAGVLVLSYIGYEQLLTSYYSELARNSWLLNVVAGTTVLISVFVSMISRQRPTLGYFNTNCILVWCLYALAIFGISYSMMPAAGIYFVKKGLPTTILMVFLLPLVINSWEVLKKMSVPIMIMGSFLIVMIIISPRTEIYGSRLFIDLSYTTGSSNGRGNPLAVAEVGGYVMLFAALYEPPKTGALIGILRLGSFILGALIAFLVGSRGQLVFALFFSVMLYPLAHQVRDIKQFFVRAASAGFSLLVIAVVGKIAFSGSVSSNRFTASDVSEGIAGRLYFAKELLGEYARNPANYLQGIGTGSFNAVVKHDGDGYLYPHNIIVEVLAHHGLIGLSLLIGIFIATGLHMLKALKLARSGLVDRSSAAIMLSLVFYTTMLAMKQGSFVLIPLPFFTYLMLSKLVTRECRSEALYWHEEEMIHDDQPYGEPGYS